MLIAGHRSVVEGSDSGAIQREIQDGIRVSERFSEQGYKRAWLFVLLILLCKFASVRYRLASVGSNWVGVDHYTTNGCVCDDVVGRDNSVRFFVFWPRLFANHYRGRLVIKVKDDVNFSSLSIERRLKIHFLSEWRQNAPLCFHGLSKPMRLECSLVCNGDTCWFLCTSLQPEQPGQEKEDQASSNSGHKDVSSNAAGSTAAADLFAIHNFDVAINVDMPPGSWMFRQTRMLFILICDCCWCAVPTVCVIVTRVGGRSFSRCDWRSWIV